MPDRLSPPRPRQQRGSSDSSGESPGRRTSGLRRESGGSWWGEGPSPRRSRHRRPAGQSRAQPRHPTAIRERCEVSNRAPRAAQGTPHPNPDPLPGVDPHTDALVAEGPESDGGRPGGCDNDTGRPVLLPATTRTRTTGTPDSNPKRRRRRPPHQPCNVSQSARSRRGATPAATATWSSTSWVR